MAWWKTDNLYVSERLTATWMIIECVTRNLPKHQNLTFFANLSCIFHLSVNSSITKTICWNYCHLVFSKSSFLTPLFTRTLGIILYDFTFNIKRLMLSPIFYIYHFYKSICCPFFVMTLSLYIRSELNEKNTTFYLIAIYNLVLYILLVLHYPDVIK